MTERNNTDKARADDACGNGPVKIQDSTSPRENKLNSLRDDEFDFAHSDDTDELNDAESTIMALGDEASQCLDSDKQSEEGPNVRESSKLEEFGDVSIEDPDEGMPTEDLAKRSGMQLPIVSVEDLTGKTVDMEHFEGDDKESARPSRPKERLRDNDAKTDSEEGALPVVAVGGASALLLWELFSGKGKIRSSERQEAIAQAFAPDVSPAEQRMMVSIVRNAVLDGDMSALEDFVSGARLAGRNLSESPQMLAIKNEFRNFDIQFEWKEEGAESSDRSLENSRKVSLTIEPRYSESHLTIEVDGKGLTTSTSKGVKPEKALDAISKKAQRSDSKRELQALDLALANGAPLSESMISADKRITRSLQSIDNLIQSGYPPEHRLVQQVWRETLKDLVPLAREIVKSMGASEDLIKPSLFQLLTKPGDSAGFFSNEFSLGVHVCNGLQQGEPLNTLRHELKHLVDFLDKTAIYETSPATFKHYVLEDLLKGIGNGTTRLVGGKLENRPTYRTDQARQDMQELIRTHVNASTDLQAATNNAAIHKLVISGDVPQSLLSEFGSRETLANEITRECEFYNAIMTYSRVTQRAMQKPEVRKYVTEKSATLMGAQSSQSQTEGAGSGEKPAGATAGTEVGIPIIENPEVKGLMKSPYHDVLSSSDWRQYWYSPTETRARHAAATGALQDLQDVATLTGGTLDTWRGAGYSVQLELDLIRDAEAVGEALRTGNYEGVRSHALNLARNLPSAEHTDSAMQLLLDKQILTQRDLRFTVFIGVRPSTEGTSRASWSERWNSVKKAFGFDRATPGIQPKAWSNFRTDPPATVFGVERAPLGMIGSHGYLVRNVGKDESFVPESRPLPPSPRVDLGRLSGYTHISVDGKSLYASQDNKVFEVKNGLLNQSSEYGLFNSYSQFRMFSTCESIADACKAVKGGDIGALQKAVSHLADDSFGLVSSSSELAKQFNTNLAAVLPDRGLDVTLWMVSEGLSKHTEKQFVLRLDDRKAGISLVVGADGPATITVDRPGKSLLLTSNDKSFETHFRSLLEPIKLTPGAPNRTGEAPTPPSDISSVSTATDRELNRISGQMALHPESRDALIKEAENLLALEARRFLEEQGFSADLISQGDRPENVRSRSTIAIGNFANADLSTGRIEVDPSSPNAVQQLHQNLNLLLDHIDRIAIAELEPESTDRKLRMHIDAEIGSAKPRFSYQLESAPCCYSSGHEQRFALTEPGKSAMRQLFHLYLDEHPDRRYNVSEQEINRFFQDKATLPLVQKLLPEFGNSFEFLRHEFQGELGLYYQGKAYLGASIHIDENSHLVSAVEAAKEFYRERWAEDPTTISKDIDSNVARAGASVGAPSWVKSPIAAQARASELEWAVAALESGDASVEGNTTRELLQNALEQARRIVQLHEHIGEGKLAVTPAVKKQALSNAKAVAGAIVTNLAQNPTADTANILGLIVKEERILSVNEVKRQFRDLQHSEHLDSIVDGIANQNNIETRQFREHPPEQAIRVMPTKNEPAVGSALNQRFIEKTAPIVGTLKMGRSIDTAPMRTIRGEAAAELVEHARGTARKLGLPDAIVQEDLFRVDDLVQGEGAYNSSTNRIHIDARNQNAADVVDHEMRHMKLHLDRAAIALAADTVAGTNPTMSDFDMFVLESSIREAGMGTRRVFNYQLVMRPSYSSVESCTAMQQLVREYAREMSPYAWTGAWYRQSDITDWLNNRGNIPEALLKEFGGTSGISAEMEKECINYAVTLDSTKASLDAASPEAKAYVEQRSKTFENWMREGHRLQDHPEFRKLTFGLEGSVLGMYDSSDYQFSIEEIRARRFHLSRELNRALVESKAPPTNSHSAKSLPPGENGGDKENKELVGSNETQRQKIVLETKKELLLRTLDRIATGHDTDGTALVEARRCAKEIVPLLPVGRPGYQCIDYLLKMQLITPDELQGPEVGRLLDSFAQSEAYDVECRVESRLGAVRETLRISPHGSDTVLGRDSIRSNCIDPALDAIARYAGDTAERLGMPREVVARDAIQFDVVNSEAGSFNPNDGKIRLDVNTRFVVGTVDHQIQHKYDCLNLLAAQQADSGGFRMAVLEGCIEEINTGRRMFSQTQVSPENRHLRFSSPELAAQFKELVRAEALQQLVRDSLVDPQRVKGAPPEANAELTAMFGGEQELKTAVAAEINNFHKVLAALETPIGVHNEASRDYINQQAERLKRWQASTELGVEDNPEVRRRLLLPTTRVLGADPRNSTEFVFSAREISARDFAVTNMLRRLSTSPDIPKESFKEHPVVTAYLEQKDLITLQKKIVRAQSDGQLEKAKTLSLEFVNRAASNPDPHWASAVEYLVDNELVDPSHLLKRGTTDTQPTIAETPEALGNRIKALIDSSPNDIRPGLERIAASKPSGWHQLVIDVIELNDRQLLPSRALAYLGSTGAQYLEHEARMESFSSIVGDVKVALANENGGSNGASHEPYTHESPGVVHLRVAEQSPQFTSERHGTLNNLQSTTRTPSAHVTVARTRPDGVTHIVRLPLSQLSETELANRLSDTSEALLHHELAATNAGLDEATKQSDQARIDELNQRRADLQQLIELKTAHERARLVGSEHEFLKSAHERGGGKSALLGKVGLASALLLLFNELVPETRASVKNAPRVVPGAL